MPDITDHEKSQNDIVFRPSTTWQLIRQVGRFLMKNSRKGGR
ncbi:MAG: hypothetical protein JWR03_1552 [Cohnella sp.]|jgi:hypothetical protein|nr:hypothetical protein [Cohnella sp.]